MFGKLAKLLSGLFGGKQPGNGRQTNTTDHNNRGGSAMSRPTLRLYDGYDHTTPELRPAVKELQQLLKNEHFDVDTDGYFGPGTERAVRLFQWDNGLDDDGVVGPTTWALLLGEEPPVDDDDGDFVGGGTKYSTTIPLNDANYLRQLKEANKYKAYIDEAARTYGFEPSVIAGVGSRESHWGLILKPPGPAGTGDHTPRSGQMPPDGGGWGRGLMQIDYKYHEFARTGNWQDPRDNILYGVKVLADSRRFFKRKTNLQGVDLLRAALAGYNAGPTNTLRAIRDGRDIDFYTTGRDYSKNVLDRAGWFQAHGWE